MSNKPTREEMIQELIDELELWPVEQLVVVCQDFLKQYLDNLTTEEIEAEYFGDPSGNCEGCCGGCCGEQEEECEGDCDDCQCDPDEKKNLLN